MIMCSVLLAGCGKKDTPTVTQLPTQVIKQDVEPTEDTQPQEDTEQVDVSWDQQTKVFDPKEFEDENDEIEQLVDILEELIEEQEDSSNN